MKLYYDKRLKKSNLLRSTGISKQKKVTSRNIKNFGKHSELLKITDDPEVYVREEIRKWNEKYRLLENRLDGQGTHVTTANLIKTLQNMNVVNVHDIEYMAVYKGSKTLNALTRLSELNLDRMHYRPKDLKKN